MFENLGEQVYNTLVLDNRWMLFLEGLGNTFIITVIAVAIGIGIGFLVAIAKVNFQGKKGWGWLYAICNVYTTVIRGTPMVVQLLIMCTIVFAVAPIEYSVYVASLTFGINSGAYVSEIVRAGIMAVPRGQTEAGRSLGLTSSMTMKNIVLPQAIKNILPALGNELIVLFKETSIVGYVAVMDLTRAGDLIRSRTFQPLIPLLLIAGIYLVIVIIMTHFLRKLEKHLAKSDAR